MKERREHYKQLSKNGDLHTTINAAMGEEWQRLTDEERAKYLLIFQQENQEFLHRITKLGIPPAAKLVWEAPPDGRDVLLVYENSHDTDLGEGHTLRNRNAVNSCRDDNQSVMV
uniref:HMG1/2-like protein n=1 Tax=Lygus hesperus TaxID=30085 RepID=A0A0A9XBR2_LYGHE